MPYWRCHRKLSREEPCPRIVKLLQSDWRVNIKHAYRESNGVADSLAGMGCGLVNQLLIFEDPPMQVCYLLMLLEFLLVSFWCSFLGFCPFQYQKMERREETKEGRKKTKKEPKGLIECHYLSRAPQRNQAAN